jgi:hypothetical protein
MPMFQMSNHVSANDASFRMHDVTRLQRNTFLVVVYLYDRTDSLLTILFIRIAIPYR